MKDFITKSTQETQKIAANLANRVIHMQGSTLQKTTLQKRRAVIIALEGELGAGKTIFVKGFAKRLGIKEKISSPTFVLIKSYGFDKSAIHPLENSRARSRGSRVGRMADLSANDFKFLIHIDAYRLKDHQDLIALGIKDIMADPQNIVLIEWSDRVKKILPKQYVKIHIDHIDKQTRKITYDRIN